MSAIKKMKAVPVKKKVYWKVPQCSEEFFKGQKPGKQIDSETFTIRKGNVSTKWYICLCPNGLKEEDKSNVSLFLHSQSAEKEDCVDFKVNFKLGVAKNERNNDNVIGAYERSREEMKEGGFGCYKFLSHADLFDTKNGFAVDGHFTVFADIILEFEVEIEKREIKVPLSALLSATMIADYKKMFDNEALSDFQLETSDNKVLKTHKFVLAARSPVLYAMLTTDMEEKQKGLAKIPDFDSKIMQEFLRFVYYNEVENLDEVAPKLIYAAEKYQLKGLKVMCLQQMLSSLELKNAVEFLKVAYEVSGANDFFNECLEMIVTNYSEALQDPSWKHLPKELLCKLVEGFCERCNCIDI